MTDVGAYVAQRAGRLQHPAGHHRLRGRRREGRLARQHLVEHDAEAVDVGAGVHVLVGRGLLRTHVGRGAEREAGLGQSLVTGAHRPRDPEVGDQRLPIHQQDVLRLDVAVHGAVPVGEVEGERDFAGKPHGVGDGELPFAAEPVAQALALDVGHRKPEPACGLAGVVDGENVGVLETGGEPDLPKKALGAEGGGQLGVQHLQGDGAVVPQVAREVHGGHAATAELALERVAVPERLLKRRHAGL